MESMKKLYELATNMNDIGIICDVQNLTDGHNVIIFMPKNVGKSIGTEFAVCKVPSKGETNG